MPAASKADNMPKMSSSGESDISDASTIPLRIVEVTSPPARTAPANSKIAATMMACLMVSALAPTDVAIALATSLAPIPQAMNMPNSAARPT